MNKEQHKCKGIIAHEIELATQLGLLNNDAICLMDFISKQRLTI